MMNIEETVCAKKRLNANRNCIPNEHKFKARQERRKKAKIKIEEVKWGIC